MDIVSGLFGKGTVKYSTIVALLYYIATVFLFHSVPFYSVVFKIPETIAAQGIEVFLCKKSRKSPIRKGVDKEYTLLRNVAYYFHLIQYSKTTAALPFGLWMYLNRTLKELAQWRIFSSMSGLPGRQAESFPISDWNCSLYDKILWWHFDESMQSFPLEIIERMFYYWGIKRFLLAKVKDQFFDETMIGP